MADAIHAEIERLKKEDISDEELRMIKTRSKANLIRSLGSNEGLASELALYQARYDDWRELFHSVDRIEKSPRRISGGSRIRRSCPITGQWGSSNLPAGLREWAQGRKEVDSEARKLIPLCCIPRHCHYYFIGRQRAACGANPDLAADTDSKLPAFHPPQPKRIVFENGMVVFLQEDHELPTIDGIARIRGGERSAPRTRRG